MSHNLWRTAGHFTDLQGLLSVNPCNKRRKIRFNYVWANRLEFLYVRNGMTCQLDLLKNLLTDNGTLQHLNWSYMHYWLQLKRLMKNTFQWFTFYLDDLRYLKWIRSFEMLRWICTVGGVPTVVLVRPVWWTYLNHVDLIEPISFLLSSYILDWPLIWPY